jgi:REP element-mobilizing transposase RayT
MLKKESKPRGWYSRGYLPHFDGGTKLQFLTFRLGDSLPQTVLEKWKTELEQCSSVEREIVLRERIEKYLDCGYGKCYLKNPEIANLVQDALLFHDGAKYKLTAWTIMPNHVHALLKPFEKLGAIEHSIKSFTANKINKLLNRSGEFWQKEVFDRYIRDFGHFEKTIAYIENNPVKARLCERASDWQFGSAWFLKNSEK